MDAAKLSFGFRKKTGRKLAASCCLLTAVADAVGACEPLDITWRDERPCKAAPRGQSAEKGGNAFLFLRESCSSHEISQTPFRRDFGANGTRSGCIR